MTLQDQSRSRLTVLMMSISELPASQDAQWLAKVTAKMRDCFQLHDDQPCVFVRVQTQTIYLVLNNSVLKNFPISSSRYGTGCRENSYQTPLGAHQVAGKIGASCLEGEIIKARVPTGKIAAIVHDPHPAEQEHITTRILWLKGMEPGYNQGEGVDSYNRYIYIHGTPEEGLIGRPASVGCIRMKNRDIMQLYDQVELDAWVYIAE